MINIIYVILGYRYEYIILDNKMTKYSIISVCTTQFRLLRPMIVEA